MLLIRSDYNSLFIIWPSSEWRMGEREREGKTWQNKGDGVKEVVDASMLIRTTMREAVNRLLRVCIGGEIFEIRLLEELIRHDADRGAWERDILENYDFQNFYDEEYVGDEDLAKNMATIIELSLQSNEKVNAETEVDTLLEGQEGNKGMLLFPPDNHVSHDGERGGQFEDKISLRQLHDNHVSHEEEELGFYIGQIKLIHSVSKMSKPQLQNPTMTTIEGEQTDRVRCDEDVLPYSHSSSWNRRIITISTLGMTHVCKSIQLDATRQKQMNRKIYIEQDG
ncbi:hypothetical protein RIF29_15710 [Crotalaria pallida]|uniref:Uncharacterized protein n=1 Tax=Crotalaria pallida TaxID=3830 RepID=A0AAN9IDT5_CROPI